jgi:hypothetical protein
VDVPQVLAWPFPLLRRSKMGQDCEKDRLEQSKEAIESIATDFFENVMASRLMD